MILRRTLNQCGTLALTPEYLPYIHLYRVVRHSPAMFEASDRPARAAFSQTQSFTGLLLLPLPYSIRSNTTRDISGTYCESLHKDCACRICIGVLLFLCVPEQCQPRSCRVVRWHNDGNGGSRGLPEYVCFRCQLAGLGESDVVDHHPSRVDCRCPGRKRCDRFVRQT